MVLLESAEDINAFPNTNEYRVTLRMYEDVYTICIPTKSLTYHSIQNQVILFRRESHRARGVFQQLRLVFLSGLAYRPYTISAQIEETRLRIEVRQITLLPAHHPTDKDISADGRRTTTCVNTAGLPPSAAGTVQSQPFLAFRPSRHMFTSRQLDRELYPSIILPVSHLLRMKRMRLHFPIFLTCSHCATDRVVCASAPRCLALSTVNDL